jgi:hypothetical protein
MYGKYQYSKLRLGQVCSWDSNHILFYADYSLLADVYSNKNRFHNFTASQLNVPVVMMFWEGRDIICNLEYPVVAMQQLQTGFFFWRQNTFLSK